MKKKKILVISPIFPLPLKSGGQVRVFYLVKYLSESYDVSLLSLIGEEDKSYISEMAKYCSRIETVTGYIHDSLSEKLRSLLNPMQLKRIFRRIGQLAAGMPLQVCRFYHPEIESKLDKLMTEDDYEIVYAIYSQIAPYLEHAKILAPDAKLVLDDIDLAFVTKSRELVDKKGIKRLVASVESKRMTEYVSKTWAGLDRIIAMSEVDRGKLKELNEAMKVSVIPNGVDVNYFRPTSSKQQDNRIVFLGGSLHYPNVDAMAFFSREIFPLLQNDIKDASLTVIGEFTERSVLQSVNPVILTGYVDDVRPHLAGGRVLVAPIRIGGGTRLKILEAMAMGIPVVSTAVGCEGIDVTDGKDIFIADDPILFAERIKLLLTDESIAAGLAQNGRRLVEQKYSWEALLKGAGDLFQTCK